MTQEPQADASPALPALAVRLAAAWVLAGALFKLFLGTPADLPPTVVDASPLGLAETYRTAIGIELAVVFLALVRPGTAWPLVVGMYAVFEVVLGAQLAAGAESCGCFGSKVTLTPLQMSSATLSPTGFA